MNLVKAELIQYFNDGEYELHVPVIVNEDRYEATYDSESEEFWVPYEIDVQPVEGNWEIVFDDETKIPAIPDYDTEGQEEMEERYGSKGYIIVGI